MEKATQTPRFCKAIGQEAWLEKEEWIDQRSRFYAMADVVAAIDEVLATKSRDEWGEIFDAAGLIWGPVLSLDEVSKDPQAEAIGLFPTIEREVAGSYRTVRIPMRMPTAKIGPKGPAPAYILVEGYHRLEAARALGEETIVAYLVQARVR